MKNKLKFLIGASLKRKIKTKWFAIANILLALAIIAVANIDHIITFFGGDFDDTTKIYVIDNTDEAYELFNSYLGQTLSTEDLDLYEVSEVDITKDVAIELIKTDEEEYNTIILTFNYSEENVIDVEIISNDYFDITTLSTINSTINNVKVYMAIEKYDISQEQLAGITNNVVINRIVLDEGKDSVDENMTVIMTSVFPIFILPFFMLVIFLVQMIGAEVNDEKTTRGMEIIISNVSPKVHFFSKCISGNVFILMQSALLIFYLIIGILTRGIFSTSSVSVFSQISTLLGGLLSASFIASLKYVIPLVLALMILTFIGYSLLAGILASMTTNTEDFQQMQVPIVFISLIGYYLAIMAGTFEGALFIKILGYVPFISAILSPSLLVMGEFGIIDVIISMILMIVVILVLIKYGLRIYKVGILNYSSGNLWKKMFNALKEK